MDIYEYAVQVDNLGMCQALKRNSCKKEGKRGNLDDVNSYEQTCVFQRGLLKFLQCMEGFGNLSHKALGCENDSMSYGLNIAIEIEKNTTFHYS